MMFALSTHWNACRHKSGEALVEEILSLGFRHVELGYDLTLDLVAGVRALRGGGAVSVTSVHSYCPVPVGAPRGHPELFSLSGVDERERGSAVLHTARAAEFAADMGAGAVVAHAGNVPTRLGTRDLIKLWMAGRGNTPAYEKAKVKLLMQRDKAAPRYLGQLRRSLDELLPAFARHGVKLALENLPSWESLPSEVEMARLLADYESPHLAYWHDVGHGQVRQNLSLSAHRHWFERLAPRLAGLHVHDVAPPAADHLMPPAGAVDFRPFAPAARSGIPLVLEPAPGTPPDLILAARSLLESLWAQPQAAAAS
jgi:sugar phosphate isomerase/epimerase